VGRHHAHRAGGWIDWITSRHLVVGGYAIGLHRRAELIGALINLTLLGVVGLYLVYEGVIGHATLEFDLGHPDENEHDVELVPAH
jgi:hypothetical protein